MASQISPILIKKVVIASGLSKIFEVDNVIVEALKNVKVKPKAIIMIVFYQALRIPESLLDYKLLKFLIPELIIS